jgi:hypothetical protein
MLYFKDFKLLLIDYFTTHENGLAPFTDDGYCRYANSPSCLSKILLSCEICSDFRNSQKLDPLQMPVKKFRPKYASLSKIFRCNKLTHGAIY